ncbi:ankyrin repeat domain-containing protein [Niastella populi]|uniref:Uncharacterized protein n=1 Tax=Niastella populi TaxID=550983 RepID=A0A1V9F583_9BACT|nr:ankyrin repeat domain-containing protein [Niastella populi]OQP53570.1 hypothetical protein A4R26_06225 [Niastella populi]
MFNFSNQSVNAPLPNGVYPIEFAINEDDPDMVKLLIEAGADPNIDLGKGFTPLHEAMDACIDCMIQNNRDTFFPEHLEMVKVLFENGADPNKKDINGISPLDLINSYAGLKEGFDKLMNLFRPAIPNIDNLITYQERHPTASNYKNIHIN